MKKLMFAVAALTAGFAMADGITSANAVGFTTDTTVQQYNFKLSAFTSVGYNTANVQDIKLVGAAGDMSEVLGIWEGAPTPVSGVDFAWINDGTSEYWLDLGTFGPAEYSIAPGQGVVINAAAGVGIQTSGQVPVEKVTFTTTAGYNFTGNPFPADIDVQNMKLVGAAGDMSEVFGVWEGAPTAVAGVDFAWVNDGTNEYWLDLGTFGPAEYTVKANQGVIISAAAGVKVEITPPYSL